jgi:hypothetical protein
MSILIEKLKGSVKSWTIWFNTIVGALILNWDVIQSSLPSLQPYMTGAHYALVMKILVIGNFILRLKTSKGLEHK